MKLESAQLLLNMDHGAEVKLVNLKVNFTSGFGASLPVLRTHFRFELPVLAYRDAIDQIIGDKHIVCPGIEMLQNFANKKNVKSKPLFIIYES